MQYKRLLFIMLLINFSGLYTGNRDVDKFYDCNVVNLYERGSRLEEIPEMMQGVIKSWAVVSDWVEKVFLYDFTTGESCSTEDLTLSQLCDYMCGNGSTED